MNNKWFKPLKIGDVILDGNVLAAPMAGVTDKAARKVAKPFGPSLLYTEMVSGKALLYKNKKTENMLDIDENEQPVAVQLFGHEPEVLAKIAQNVCLNGAKIIDINMGCPAPKIVNNGDGSAIMKNPYLAAEIIKAVKTASSVPVTVKIRKGWDEKSINAVEVAKAAEEAGADAVTVHGRCRADFYSGECDLEIIKKVKDAVKIPVIGNGDITDGKSAERMFETTGCDGVMIGRASEGNPWIYAEVINYLKTGTDPKPVDLKEKCAVMRKHLNLLVLCKGEHIGILEARKHMAWYVKGIKEGTRLKEMIFKASKKEEMEKIIDILEKHTESEKF